MLIRLNKLNSPFKSKKNTITYKFFLKININNAFNANLKNNFKLLNSFLKALNI
jgi:hypothetical protein